MACVVLLSTPLAPAAQPRPGIRPTSGQSLCNKVENGCVEQILFLGPQFQTMGFTVFSPPNLMSGLGNYRLRPSGCWEHSPPSRRLMNDRDPRLTVCVRGVPDRAPAGWGRASPCALTRGSGPQHRDGGAVQALRPQPDSDERVKCSEPVLSRVTLQASGLLRASLMDGTPGPGVLYLGVLPPVPVSSCQQPPRGHVN